jgi:hypothetical protein
MIGGLVLALPLSILAFRRAPDRGFAITALVLSTLETLLLLGVLALACLL